MTLSERWGVSRQLAYTWAKRYPERVALLADKDPAHFKPLAERYAATAMDVATWPAGRLALLAAGAAVEHERGEVADVAAECHKRGFMFSEMAEATGWEYRSMYAWRTGPRLARLWDAILGMEALA